MANYTKRAGVYLNAQEKEELERKAAEAGLNKSEYMRHLIRTSNLKPYPEGYLEKVKTKIKVFGDEINEIAKAVNSRGFVKPEEIRRIIELEECLLVVLREDLHQDSSEPDPKVDIVRSLDYNNSTN